MMLQSQLESRQVHDRNNLWQKAFETLDEATKKSLSYNVNNKVNVLSIAL